MRRSATSTRRLPSMIPRSFIWRLLRSGTRSERTLDAFRNAYAAWGWGMLQNGWTITSPDSIGRGSTSADRQAAGRSRPDGKWQMEDGKQYILFPRALRLARAS